MWNLVYSLALATPSPPPPPGKCLEHGGWGGPGLEGEEREGEQTGRYLEARDQAGAWREKLHCLPPPIFSLRFTLLTVTLATAPQTEEAVTMATCSGASYQLPPSPPRITSPTCNP